MSKRQPDLFELEPDADETDSERNPQGRLDFVIPFAETRSMRMQSAECLERSRRECEQFEDNFSEAETDSSAD